MSDHADAMGSPAAPSGATDAQLLRGAEALLASGDYYGAISYYMQLVQRRPEMAEYHRRLGSALLNLRQLDAAHSAISEALRLQGDDAQAHGDMSRLLVQSGQIPQALDHARRAACLAPSDPELAVALGALLYADHQNEAAWAIVERMLAQGRKTQSLAVLYGQMASERKCEAQALDLTLTLLEEPSLGTPRVQSTLHLMAAKLLDALARYDDAFAQASRGNGLLESRYHPARAEQLTREWMEYFTRSSLKWLPHAAPQGRAPVFIVGMPRSGTTLIEQILSSHPAVHGAGEFHGMFSLWPSALQRTPGAASLTQCLDRLSGQDFEALATEYLNSLWARSPDSLWIVDKHPGNYMNLGLISLLLPQAKIIHARRDPLDTCLSCFLTDFASNLDFHLSLSSCGHYYRHYRKIMKHWTEVLDLEILDVDYENVVRDVEAETRRILQFLDLPWDRRCLDFHQNNRFIANASSVQVRLPIYTKSVGRWRHYHKHLQPLRDALAEN